MNLLKLKTLVGLAQKKIVRNESTAVFNGAMSQIDFPPFSIEPVHTGIKHTDDLPYAETVDLKSRVFYPLKSLLPKASFLPKEPIVFIHGIFGNSRMYSKHSQQTADALQTPVYSVDIRNHGNSPRALPMDYETTARDLAKYIRDNNLGKVNIAGFSMGAKVAMLYSLMYPEQTARAVIIDNSPLKQKDILAMLYSFADGLIKVIDDAKIRSTDNDWYEKANEVMKHSIKDPLARKYLMATNLVRERPTNPDGYVHLVIPVKHLKALIEDVGDWPLELTNGKRFDGPTLFLKATMSPFIKRSYHGVINSYFPQNEIEKITSGHLIIDERPDEVLTKVTNWFKRNPLD